MYKKIATVSTSAIRKLYCSYQGLCVMCDMNIWTLLCLLPSVVGFYANLLECCEAKCSASSAESNAMRSCKMKGCMARWNGNVKDRCILDCNEVVDQEEQRMCIVGCNNYVDCDCPKSQYFYLPSSWAFKRQDETCRRCPPVISPHCI